MRRSWCKENVVGRSRKEKVSIFVSHSLILLQIDTDSITNIIFEIFDFTLLLPSFLLDRSEANVLLEGIPFLPADR